MPLCQLCLSLANRIDERNDVRDNGRMANSDPFITTATGERLVLVPDHLWSAFSGALASCGINLSATSDDGRSARADKPGVVQNPGGMIGGEFDIQCIECGGPVPADAGHYVCKGCAQASGKSECPGGVGGDRDGHSHLGGAA